MLTFKSILSDRNAERNEYLIVEQEFDTVITRVFTWETIKIFGILSPFPNDWSWLTDMLDDLHTTSRPQHHRPSWSSSIFMFLAVFRESPAYKMQYNQLN